MTTVQVMSACETYYGEKYQGLFGDLVAQYLDTLTDEIRAALLASVVRRVSRSFGKSPDVAAFEAALGDAVASIKAGRPALAAPVFIPSERDREEMARLIEEAKRTPVGQWLFGRVIPEGGKQ